MKDPTPLMRRAAEALFPGDAIEQDHFLRALLDPARRPGAILWTGPRTPGAIGTLSRDSLPDWVPDSIDLVPAGTKVGNSAAYTSGSVYPLDLSSVATGSAMRVAGDSLPTGPRVLDLCAAPGGKSLLASVWLQPSLLLANEVEGKRLGMLRHNLARCQVDRVFTQKMEPAQLAALAPEAFHLALVDAPCSGQSLLAKGIENPGCFFPGTVKGNARRQSRILSEAARLVCPGGFLLYTTCTFSPRENEGVIERFLKIDPAWTAVAVRHLEGLRTPHSPLPAYRIFPQGDLGVGGFAALLHRTGEVPAALPPLPAPLLDYPAGSAASPR